MTMPQADPLQAQHRQLDRLAALEDGLDDVGREEGERDRLNLKPNWPSCEMLRLM